MGAPKRLTKEKRLTKRRWKVLPPNVKKDVLNAIFPHKPEVVSLLLEMGYDTSLFWWGIVYTEARILANGNHSVRVGKVFI